MAPNMVMGRFFALTTILYFTIFITPIQAMNLKDSLLHAYKHNPTILAAREDLKQADETVSEAKSNFLPNSNVP